MDLILWRHADALDARELQDDLERALTAKGERQAQRTARWLNHVLPSTTKVLVSPARRAQQTAKALDRRFKTVDALRPDGSVSELLEAARWPLSRKPVLVVGHQPTLGQVAAHLVGGAAAEQAASWRIKKGGVWWLRSTEGDDGTLQVTVVTVRTPELL